VKVLVVQEVLQVQYMYMVMALLIKEISFNPWALQFLSWKEEVI
jgi:hypothetical protein